MTSEDICLDSWDETPCSSRAIRRCGHDARAVRAKSNIDNLIFMPDEGIKFTPFEDVPHPRRLVSGDGGQHLPVRAKARSDHRSTMPRQNA